MRMFMVRLQETKELVGFFMVPHINCLGDDIDECTDPGGCEYAEIEEFSMFWPKPGTPKFKVIDTYDDGDGDDWDETEWDFSSVDFGDRTWSHIFDIERGMKGKSERDLTFYKIIPTNRIYEWDYEGEYL